MTTTRPRSPASDSGALLNQRAMSSSGAVVTAAIIIRRLSHRRAPRFQRAAQSGDAKASRVKSDPLSRSCRRSEEHTSELQSLMRISYAVFCLKKKKKTHITSPLTYLLSLHYIIQSHT